MAEVLITLGIIGIIAAMTLPSLIGKWQKKEAVVRLQRAYTLLNQAVLMAQNKYGEPKDWPDWNSPEKIINNYIAPEFKVNKIYEPSTDSYFKGMCWDGNHFFHNDRQYNWLSGIYISSPIEVGTASFMTIDGICIGLYSTSIDDVRIFVDVNSSVKGPNVAGKDLFFFVFQDNTIKPYGYNWKIQELTGTNNSACNSKATNGAGHACAAKVMNDGWEMKDDYPW